VINETLELKQERRRAYIKAWREKNKDRVLAQSKKWNAINSDRRKTIANRFAKKWREANREKSREISSRYRKENPEKIRESYKVWAKLNRNYLREKDRIKRATDPQFRLRKNLSRRIREKLGAGGKKSVKTMSLIGCSIDHLRLWLTFYFQPGMSWSNYGKVWHIDHIKPCARFQLSDPKQQKICFHYTNLQPLFAEDNLRKGARYA
jgi:Prasinovirus endonuclease VII